MTESTSSPADEAARRILQYRELLGHLLDCTQRILPTVRFDKRRSQHVAAMCIYATILQSIGECHRLMDRSTVTVPGIMRSVLESYADLSAVIANPEYPKKMLATLYEEQRKHLQDVIKEPQNPFHAQLAAKIDPRAELSKVTSSLDHLRQEGHVPLRIKDRLDAAGLANIYRTVYWELCLHDHNNLAVLESRHIRRTGETQFEIDVFAENSAHQIGTSYDTLTGILADASHRLYRLLEFSPPDEFNRQVEAFERFRPEAVNILTAQTTPRENQYGQ
ncbi:MAG TPA: DUF5677 domain-containing protein [Steroidobacteraceae bacterium]|nr:DUF5677 domain-containing protein [Steroidobacteraceae bacterium]